MSSLWVLGLGASVGYLLFKRDRLGEAVERQAKEWTRGTENRVTNETTEGIKFSDIKAQWRYNKDDDQKKHFNERLPESEVTRLAAGEAAIAQSVQAFEPEQQKIQGFFLEGVPS